MTRLLVLVLACGALLISTEAQQDYHSLPDHYKEAIKLAVKNAHQRTSQHMNFYATQGLPKIADDYIEIEFLLKATNCAKLTVPDHRDDCVFMTNRQRKGKRLDYQAEANANHLRGDLKRMPRAMNPSWPYLKTCGLYHKPLINCRVCSKRSGNDLTDPSIDCAPQKRVDKDKRQKMCRPITGRDSPMAVKAAEKAEIDCPGCY